MPKPGVLILLVLTCSCVLILTTIFVVGYQSRKKHIAQFPIYCIMITGKDDARIKYAKMSVENFANQTYNNKVLLIINHHESMRVLSHHTQHSNLFEFKIPKTPSTTLGDLRNIALQMVAHNACWTTWDDDDYRAPCYLTTLASYMPASFDRVISLSKRFEYNKNNGVSWMGTKTNGMVLFLAPFDNRITYLQTDSMEDVNMLSDFQKVGYTLKVIDNDPCLYVRLVHTNNTSLFVKPQRDYLMRAPHYYERFLNRKESMYIDKIKGYFYH